MSTSTYLAKSRLLLLLAIALFPFFLNAQRTTLKTADSHFANLSYYEASLYYEQAFRKGAEGSDNFRKLATCYRMMRDSENAEIWYAKLCKSGEEHNQDRLHYAEMLRMNGKYEKADEWLSTYLENEQGDERAKNLAGSSASVNAWIRNGIFKGVVRPLSSNTKTADWSPAFLGDKVVISSSRTGDASFRRYHGWDGKAFLDLYVGTPTDGGDVPELQPLPKTINTRYHESSPTFNVEGTEMYFTRNQLSGQYLRRDVNGVNNLQIYRSVIENGKWSKATPFAFNNAEWSTGHPSLAADGRELFFVSDRPGGFGGSDIYVSVKQSDGTWGEPKNLGPRVNTEGNEMTPSISTDGTLFFASDGHAGLGGMDIYLTVMNGVEPGEVMNLGAPLNTQFDELSLVMHPTGEFGYFSSNREGGAGDDDVYHFSLRQNYDRDGFFTNQDEDIEPEEVEETLVHSGSKRFNFKIVDARNKESLKGAELFFEEHLYSGAAAIQAESDESGIMERTMTIDLAGSNELLIVRDGYLPYLVPSSAGRSGMVGTNEYTEISMTPLNEGVDLGKAIGLDAIYFDVESWELSQTAKQQLKRIAFVLKRNPAIKIELGSHTDCNGSSGFNDVLSQMRANASKEELVELGIDPLRIEARGYGESKPVNHCVDGIKCAEEELQMNRRTEFRVQ